jgi:hypothetical protein
MGKRQAGQVQERSSRRIGPPLGCVRAGANIAHQFQPASRFEQFANVLQRGCGGGATGHVQVARGIENLDLRGGGQLGGRPTRGFLLAFPLAGRACHAVRFERDLRSRRRAAHDGGVQETQLVGGGHPREPPSRLLTAGEQGESRRQPFGQDQRQQRRVLRLPRCRWGACRFRHHVDHPRPMPPGRGFEIDPRWFAHRDIMIVAPQHGEQPAHDRRSL